MTGYSFSTPVWDGGAWVTPVVAEVRVAAPRANGPEDQSLDAPDRWDRIDWREQEEQVRRLRQRIFKGAHGEEWAESRELQKLKLRSPGYPPVGVGRGAPRRAAGQNP